MNGGAVVIIIFTGMIGALGFTAILTEHHKNIVKMRLQQGKQGDASTEAALQAMREEIRALRDTSMQYDLSFDTALQRMEQRMSAMERRVNQVEPGESQKIGIGQ